MSADISVTVPTSVHDMLSRTPVSVNVSLSGRACRSSWEANGFDVIVCGSMA